MRTARRSRGNFEHSHPLRSTGSRLGCEDLDEPSGLHPFLHCQICICSIISHAVPPLEPHNTHRLHPHTFWNTK